MRTRLIMTSRASLTSLARIVFGPVIEKVVETLGSCIKVCELIKAGGKVMEGEDKKLYRGQALDYNRKV